MDMKKVTFAVRCYQLANDLRQKADATDEAAQKVINTMTDEELAQYVRNTR
jgi:hypothetical protein